MWRAEHRLDESALRVMTGRFLQLQHARRHRLHMFFGLDLEGRPEPLAEILVFGRHHGARPLHLVTLDHLLESLAEITEAAGGGLELFRARHVLGTGLLDAL